MKITCECCGGELDLADLHKGHTADCAGQLVIRVPDDIRALIDAELAKRAANEVPKEESS